MASSVVVDVSAQTACDSSPNHLQQQQRHGSHHHDHTIPPEARALLRSLALNLWSDMHAYVEDVSIRPLKGAMTNEVYECSWNTVPFDEDLHSQQKKQLRRVVLVRVYGEGVELFFNREDEIRTFEAMSRAGCGPRLLGRFPNGRVEEFLHARTLSASDLRDPYISSKIAAKMREFHQLAMPGSREPLIWQRLRDWLHKAIALCTPELIEEFRLRDLDKEITELRQRISHPESRIGFCHNDLQYGNIMMDEEDNSLTIIDYEYSTYNPVAYDLANHFCEMAADYHTDTPHVLDYSKYPDLEEQKRFVTEYLEGSGETTDENEIKELMKEIDGYVLASHIHWGLWGIISERVNEIEFDYLEYARQRFYQYYLHKSDLIHDDQGVPACNS